MNQLNKQWSISQKITWYKSTLDTLKYGLKMVSTQDSTDMYNLRYIKNDSTLLLKGTWKKDSIQINMDEYDLTKFKLMNRGFHWINEYPN